MGETMLEADALRASVIRCVLQDFGADRENVLVDPKCASSGTEIADRHAADISANSRVLHIVGSDVAKRPGRFTVVVQRSEADAAGAEPYLDIRQWRVMCVQEEHR
eukprot:5529229-Amphidinium_carterae.1